MRHDRDNGDAVNTTLRGPRAHVAERRITSQTSGQALVEFGLVIFLIVFMLVAVFDVGRAVYAYNTVSNAARQGARVAAVNQILTSPDCTEDRPIVDPANPHWSVKECAAEAAATLGVTAADVSVSYSAPPGTYLTCTSSQVEVGCVVTVTVTYTYSPITPLIGQVIGQVQLSSTSQALVERVFP